MGKDESSEESVFDPIEVLKVISDVVIGPSKTDTDKEKDK